MLGIWLFLVHSGEIVLACVESREGSRMASSNKKRFSVSLDVDDYQALKQIAKNQRPSLSLQYIVSYALTEFIAVHQSNQIELDLGLGLK